MGRASFAPEFDAAVFSFYRRALRALIQSEVPFMVGGGYALRHYTGIARDSRDLDLFCRPRDRDRLLGALADDGFRTEITFPHWLGKVFDGDRYIDVIFNSGNGVAVVDDAWFEHAAESSLLDYPVSVCPAEETIWSKAFVLERERCDVADVAHILRARADRLDWERLVARFGDRHHRVLLGHLVFFGFIYPEESKHVPRWVMDALIERMQNEPRTDRHVCNGTLLSREQYLVDLERWGYEDARKAPRGPMRPSHIALWTAAIGKH